jgi:hypothetical protein
VKRRIGKIAFELDLPDYLKIHPVISCIHLKPALPAHLENQAPPPPLQIEGEERYLVDRILRKEQRRQPGDRARQTYYRVR